MIMITLIRPILFSFLQSEKVKLLIVDMLTKLVQSTDNDIALLKLEKELDFNERVQPACLPYESYYKPFNVAFASGWGQNEPGGEQIFCL